MFDVMTCDKISYHITIFDWSTKVLLGIMAYGYFIFNGNEHLQLLAETGMVYYSVMYILWNTCPKIVKLEYQTYLAGVADISIRKQIYFNLIINGQLVVKYFVVKRQASRRRERDIHTFTSASVITIFTSPAKLNWLHFGVDTEVTQFHLQTWFF